MRTSPTFLLWASSLALVTALAACSSDAGRAPAPDGSSGGEANRGGSTGSGARDPGSQAGSDTGGAAEGGSGGEPDGGSSGGDTQNVAGAPSGSGGTSGDGLAGSGNDPAGGTDSEGGAPPVAPTLCDLLADWGAPEPITGVSTPDADETLLALTADERSLIFRRDDTLYRADRASADADWDAPATLELPQPYTAEYGVALSPDGLRLVLVRSDRRAFGELTRSSRYDDFSSTVITTPFTALNDESGYQYYDYATPLIAASDQTLYYVGQYGESFVFPSALGSAGWTDGWQLFDASAGLSGDAKLITGLSADERTLFMFDEELGHVVSLWRTGASEPFLLGAEFAERLTATPSADCGRLYTTRNLGNSLDIVVESPQ